MLCGSLDRPEVGLTERTKTVLSWSSGKDSAYALWVLRQRPDLEVVGLLTTLNDLVKRVSLHGVRDSVLEAQARACGLPLLRVPLPDPCGDEEYRAAMTHAVDELHGRGVEAIAFGDLFLAEVRAYREAHLAGTGITPLFPLWGRPTSTLAREMLDAGVEAIITCVDTERLDSSFAGRFFDRRLLEDLPPSVDPCAENGEFHTVAIAGPMFQRALQVELGEVVVRDRFVFADVSLSSLSAMGNHTCGECSRTERSRFPSTVQAPFQAGPQRT